MNIFMGVFRFARRCLRSFMLLYWAVFSGYTIVRLIEGGPGRVQAWYRHTSTWITATEGPSATFVVHELNQRQFWSIQAFYLAVTLFFAVFKLNQTKRRLHF
jgi:hypothetical protein